MLSCSASTLDEEVWAAKLSCGLTEPAREEHKETSDTCALVVVALGEGVGETLAGKQTAREPHLQ